MLPFLPKKNVGSVVSQVGKSDFTPAAEKSDMDPGKLQAAEDILRAIESKSPHDLAKALSAAFSMYESQEEPSEVEGE